MLKFKYVSMQKDVFEKKLGGYSHFKGVTESLKKKHEVVVVGYLIDTLNVKGVKNKSLSKRFFYFRLLYDYICDFESDVYLARKTLVGSLLFSIIFPWKKMLLTILDKKQILVLEYNGVSGEFFQNLPGVFKNALNMVNVLPTIFSDYTYCVNDYIKKSILCRFNKDKVFVCYNGGPEFSRFFKYDEIDSDKKVKLVFYGSDQEHYDIPSLAEFIASQDSLELILVGPGFEKYQSSNVKCVGPMKLEELRQYLGENVALYVGIIPLKPIITDKTIRPIKVLDYMSLGMPILHSCYCLEGFEPLSDFKFEYDSLVDITSLLSEISSFEYKNLSRYVESAYKKYTWDVTLNSLIDIDKNEQYQ